MKKLYSFLKTVFEFFDSAAQHRIGPYAAQASFFILLSLVPAFMFLLSLINFVLPYVISVSVTDISTYIYAFFPEPVSGVLDGIVRDIMERSSGISLVTAITALWFSSRGIMALIQGVNNVLSDGEIQNYFVVRFKSVVYMFIFTALLVLTIAVLGFGGHIVDYMQEIWPLSGGMLDKVLDMRWLIVFVILGVFFTLFYRFMPVRSYPFYKLIPGAALASAGWLVFTYGFSVYVGISKSYASIYGGISYVILAMLWLYFCMTILLYGAEFNYRLHLFKTYNKNT